MTKFLVHPARARRPLASSFLLLLLLVLLSACETPGGLSGSGEGRAARLAEDGQHAEAASAYIVLASESQGEERDRLTLLAVEQWLDAGDLPRARNAFANVVPPTSGNLLPRLLSRSAAGCPTWAAQHW